MPEFGSFGSFNTAGGALPPGLLDADTEEGVSEGTKERLRFEVVPGIPEVGMPTTEAPLPTVETRRPPPEPEPTVITEPEPVVITEPDPSPELRDDLIQVTGPDPSPDPEPFEPQVITEPAPTGTAEPTRTDSGDFHAAVCPPWCPPGHPSLGEPVPEAQDPLLEPIVTGGGGGALVPGGGSRSRAGSGVRSQRLGIGLMIISGLVLYWLVARSQGGA